MHPPRNLNFRHDNFWHMDKEGTGRIREAMADLCEPLHDVFTLAGAAKILAPPDKDTSNAEPRPDFSGPDYGWFRTHAIRAHAHYFLKQRELGAWKLTGKHRLNGELWLSDGNYHARILHGPSETDVPPPGHNAARIAYYHNPLLALQGTLFGPPDDRLLILWRLNPQTGAPAFRVVRPIGRWKPGRKAKIDLDFPLPATIDELIGMGFQPTDSGIRLTIPNEEKDDDFRAGGIPG